MKIICLSDVHLMWEIPIGRLDDIVITQRRKMQFILQWAKKVNGVIVQAGDFFDTARSWHLTEYYVRFFKEYLKVDLFAVYGQHDTYMYSERTRNATGLGLLIADGYVQELNDVGTEIAQGIFAQGVSYGQEVPEPVENADLNVLVIHRMIGPHKLWASQENLYYAPKFLRDHKGYDLIVCGDCHRQFRFKDGKRVILNSGCLTRHIADDYNMESAEPGFYAYDTEERTTEFIIVPHEPSEKVLSRKHIEDKKRLDKMMEEFVEGVDEEGESDLSVDFISNLIQFCAENKITKAVRDLISEVMDEEVEWGKKKKPKDRLRNWKG